MLFFLAVLPEKGQEVLHILEVDEEHLAQDRGLQLFFIAELRLVLYSAFANDDAVACHLLEVQVLALGFLEDS